MLNEVLVQMPGFNIAAYLNLVKQYFGQQACNDIAAGLIYTQQLRLSEHHLYGSSRLGIRYADTTLLSREITITGFDSTGAFLRDDVLDSTVLTLDTANYYRMLAQKQYELTDHLGNVKIAGVTRFTSTGLHT